MKTREKQNKHKLKFDYIAQLKILGKIWKEHCNLVNSNISKDSSSYNEEVIKLMSKRKIDKYCSILDKCDDLAFNIPKVDESLKKSHQNFEFYKKIILKHNN